MPNLVMTGASARSANAASSTSWRVGCRLISLLALLLSRLRITSRPTYHASPAMLTATVTVARSSNCSRVISDLHLDDLRQPKNARHQEKDTDSHRNEPSGRLKRGWRYSRFEVYRKKNSMNGIAPRTMAEILPSAVSAFNSARKRLRWSIDSAAVWSTSARLPPTSRWMLMARTAQSKSTDSIRSRDVLESIHGRPAQSRLVSSR